MFVGKAKFSFRVLLNYIDNIIRVGNTSLPFENDQVRYTPIIGLDVCMLQQSSW